MRKIRSSGTFTTSQGYRCLLANMMIYIYTASWVVTTLLSFDFHVDFHVDFHMNLHDLALFAIEPHYATKVNRFFGTNTRFFWISIHFLD